MRIKRIYKGFKSNLIIIIALSSFAYMVFVGLGGGSDESKAWVLAKHEVETQLKSPTSAKFPSSSEAEIMDLGDMYIVTSYVDAENSFGAMMRNKFSVTFKKDSKGNYITDSVYISE